MCFCTLSNLPFNNDNIHKYCIFKIGNTDTTNYSYTKKREMFCITNAYSFTKLSMMLRKNVKLNEIHSTTSFEDVLIIVCSPGYHGPFCNMICRYPNYGEDCQLNCLCDEEQCDHITGCVGKSNV